MIWHATETALQPAVLQACTEQTHHKCNKICSDLAVTKLRYNMSHRYCNQLITWRGVLAKLTVTKIVKKMLSFYGTQRFIIGMCENDIFSSWRNQDENLETFQELRCEQEFSLMHQFFTAITILFTLHYSVLLKHTFDIRSLFQWKKFHKSLF
jgi:hypothetical protein